MFAWYQVQVPCQYHGVQLQMHRLRWEQLLNCVLAIVFKVCWSIELCCGIVFKVLGTTVGVLDWIRQLCLKCAGASWHLLAASLAAVFTLICQIESTPIACLF